MLRGPAPIQHAIAQGHRETGVSIIGINPLEDGVDTGDLWQQARLVSCLKFTLRCINLGADSIPVLKLLRAARYTFEGGGFLAHRSSSKKPKYWSCV